MPTLHAPRGARVAAPAAVALALSLCPLTPAAAQGVTSDDPQAVAAYGVARAHWQDEPCGGAVSVRWARLDRGLNALARWWARSLDDPSSYYDCRVLLNARATWDWPKLCTVVVHEVGHLLGLGHASDPDDVMHEVYTAPLARCSRRRPPPCRRADGSRPSRGERRALCPATRYAVIAAADGASFTAASRWEGARTAGR